MADIAEEYRSSLSELNFNSKPHINMLTMLAEENISHASLIVQTIVDHVNSVTPDVKLPSLYLVDSIVKNIGKVYVSLFSKHLVSLFTSVFEKVDENIRSLLYKLRSTWTNIFPNAVLLRLDKSVVLLDPAWPILAQPSHKNIHVNPKFLDKPAVQLPKVSQPALTPQNATLREVEMKKKQLALLQVLQKKKQQLMHLKLKAALTPAVALPVKVDAKKPVNARDPRLSKKLAAASVESDSTVLQSVVVVPKGSDKKNDRDSPATKKAKLDEALSSFKKHSKNKTNSDSAGIEDSKKVNANSQNMPSQTPHTHKNTKSKKRPCVTDNAVEFHAELNKSNKKPSLDLESKNDLEGVILKQMSFDKLEDSNQLKSHSHFATKVTVADENSFHYKQQPNMMAEVYDKNIRKLEPPPPPPLFLGNEDKDYRILPKDVDSQDLNKTTYPKSLPVPIVKSFKLDNKERKVYFVNDRSFAFLDDNIPRELTFEGPPRLVYIECLPHPIELGFGGHEVKFEIDGKCNFIKFGTPAKEVYINDHPYEAQFGGLPFTAVLTNDKVHRIQISGPPPQVIQSNTPAFELYDRFCMNNQEFLRRFESEPTIKNDMSSQVPTRTHDVDMRMNNNGKFSSFFNFPLEKMNDVDWQRVHIDNSRQTEGSAPKNSFETVKDVKSNFTHRNFTENPDWKRPVPLPEMQNTSINIPPPLPPKQFINRFPSMPPRPPTLFGPSYSGVNTPLLPFPSNVPPRPFPPINVPFPHPIRNSGQYVVAPEVNNTNVPIVRRLSPPPLPPFLGPVPNTSCMASLPVPTSAPYNNTIVSAPLPLSHTSAPLLSMPPPTSVPRLAAPIPVTNLAASSQMPSFSAPGKVPNFTAVEASASATSTSSNSTPVNMNLFLEKLVAAGLIGKNSGTTTPPSTAETEITEDLDEELPKEELIPEITFVAKSLKEFHSGVISALYNGSQCATCGMRFKEIQSEQYSRHLDWHFRRNRREKDGAKKPFSRRWYYEVKDWIEFKEFEDVDERAPSYFELQANVEQPEEFSPENVSSVPCSECESEKCAVCGEQFQLFWVEEEEEWHIRNAVKHDDEVYHPACYEDYKKANESTVTDPDTSIDESAADMKIDAEELDSDVNLKTEELCVDVKEETELDVDVKEETELDVDVKEETELDLDVKQDIKLEVDVKDRQLKVELKEKIQQSDVDMKENTTEVDVDMKENTAEVDVDMKENTAEVDVDMKENAAEVDVDIKENTAEVDVDMKQNSAEVDVDMKQNSAEVDVDMKQNSAEVDVDTEKADLDVKNDAEEANIDLKRDAEESNLVANDAMEANNDVKRDAEEPNLVAKDAMEANIVTKDAEKANLVAKDAMEANIVAKDAVEANIVVKDSLEANLVAKDALEANIVAKDTEKANIVAKDAMEANLVAKDAEANLVENDAEEANLVETYAEAANLVENDAEEANLVETDAEAANLIEIDAEEANLVENDAEEANPVEKDADEANDVARNAEKENYDVEKVSERANLEDEVEKADFCVEIDTEDLHAKKEAKKLEQDKREETKELDHKDTSATELINSDTKCDEKVEVKSELVGPQVITKVEPMDIDEVRGDSKSVKEKCEGDTVINISAVKPAKLDNVCKQSQSSSQVENVPIKYEDEFEVIEFRPPTPDPRFQVLPPVFKGTEISNLCIIM